MEIWEHICCIHNAIISLRIEERGHRKSLKFLCKICVHYNLYCLHFDLVSLQPAVAVGVQPKPHGSCNFPMFLSAHGRMTYSQVPL